MNPQPDTTRPSGRWQDPALLAHLDRVREPWHRLVRRVVRAVLGRFLPTPPGPAVEIGAGGGQLRDWLPPEVAAVTTHTEPSEPYLEVLRRRQPDVRVERAEATHLPFAPGELGAVLGLCVLDTVPNLAAVRDEARRVLRPGGVVVHVLDLSASPDCLFPALVAGGEVPLTNFTAEPGLTIGLSEAQKAVLPPADEFDEVLAIRWDAFVRFVGMMEAARHPLAADLGPYARLGEPGRLDPYRLGQGFMAVRGDSARLLALNRALLGLTLAARGLGRDWPLRAVSLRADLRELLRGAFGPENGFAVEFAGPVSAWEREMIAPAGRFVLRHAGRTIRKPTGTPIPGTPVEELEGTTAPAAVHPTRATTVEVFVARRTG